MKLISNSFSENYSKREKSEKSHETPQRTKKVKENSISLNRHQERVPDTQKIKV